jgi:hypothetical protein
MKLSSIAILETHKDHWHTLKNAGYIKNLEYPVKLELQSVIQAELDPHYHENLWCGECVAGMVRRAYTHYERYLEIQKAEENLKAAANEAAKTMAKTSEAIGEASKAMSELNLATKKKKK